MIAQISLREAWRLALGSGLARLVDTIRIWWSPATYWARSDAFSQEVRDALDEIASSSVGQKATLDAASHLILAARLFRAHGLGELAQFERSAISAWAVSFALGDGEETR